MEKLKDMLNSDNNNCDWSYYHGIHIPANALVCGDKALKFIKSYFELAGKETVFSFPQIPQYEKVLEERAPHIVSTFLLGKRIAECVGINIAERNENGMSFQYYWFLSCLYHDLGYVYENQSSCEHLRMISIDGLEAIQEVCGITYLHNREFKTYSREDVDLYLRKRAICKDGKRGVIDHGIVGGLMLYDGLRKRFEESWKKRTDREHSNRYSFDIKVSSRTLHCSNSHFQDYAKAADAIIMHNIWVSTLFQYMNEEGITRKISNDPIRCDMGNQLCFILCLADTIEPIKRKPEYVDRVSFSFCNKQITIETDEDVMEDVYRNIKKCESWLSVNIQKERNRVSISIK